MRSSFSVDEVPAAGTVEPRIAIRLLAPGDEGVVRQLATYDGLGDPERLLADPRTLLLVARERGIRSGFVLADEENVAANGLYRSAGGSSRPEVLWDFRYEDG